jgi:hypothetical protein
VDNSLGKPRFLLAELGLSKVRCLANNIVARLKTTKMTIDGIAMYTSRDSEDIWRYAVIQHQRDGYTQDAFVSQMGGSGNS